MNKAVRARTRLGVLVLAAVCAVAGGGAFAAQPPPAAGRFLVAARGQPGVFSGSVILLIAYGPDGVLGVIVNRPTKVPLAKVLVNPGELEGRSAPLYFGGPVAFDQLTLLIRSKAKPPDAVHVVGDVYASDSVKALRAVAGRKLANARFRGYAGYAGWAPGQLDSEIARGGWKVLPATADDVFTTNPVGLWRKLIRRPNLQLVESGSASRAAGTRE